MDDTSCLIDLPTSLQFNKHILPTRTKPVVKPYLLPEKSTSDYENSGKGTVGQVLQSLQRVRRALQLRSLDDNQSTDKSHHVQFQDIVYRSNTSASEIHFQAENAPLVQWYSDIFKVLVKEPVIQFEDQCLQWLKMLNTIPPSYSFITIKSKDTVELGLEEIYQQCVQNDGASAIKLKLKGSKVITESSETNCRDSIYYIPARSSFIMGDVEKTAQILLEAIDGHLEKPKCIIIDPPWPNKSVARSSVYKVNRNLGYLKALPIQESLSKTGVVAVWCTNKEKYVNFVKKVLFKKWNLTLVSTWTWLKITAFGEPLFDVYSNMRKPWEQLLIGVTSEYTSVYSDKIPPTFTIIGIPDYHSRKPSLKPFISRWFNCSANESLPVLEIFGRSLTPNWITWGREPLLFMHELYWSSDN